MAEAEGGGNDRRRKRKPVGKMSKNITDTLSKMAQQVNEVETNNNTQDQNQKAKHQFGGIKHIKLSDFGASSETQKEETGTSSVYMGAGLKLDAFDFFHKSLNTCISGSDYSFSVADAAQILRQISPDIIKKIIPFIKEDSSSTTSSTSKTCQTEFEEEDLVDGSVDLEVSELTKSQKNEAKSFRKPKNFTKRPDASRPTRMLSPGSNSCSPVSAAVQALISISAPVSSKTNTITQSHVSEPKPSLTKLNKKLPTTFIPFSKPTSGVREYSSENVFLPVHKPEPVTDSYQKSNISTSATPEIEVPEVMTSTKKQADVIGIKNTIQNQVFLPHSSFSHPFNNASITRLNDYAMRQSMNYNMYNQKDVSQVSVTSSAEDTLPQLSVLLNAQSLPDIQCSLPSPYSQVVLPSSPMQHGTPIHAANNDFQNMSNHHHQQQNVIHHVQTCQESPTIPMQSMTSQIVSTPSNIPQSPHQMQPSPHQMQQSSNQMQPSPHQMQPSPHHMQQSPHHMLQSPHQMQQSPHQMQPPQHTQHAPMNVQIASPTPVDINQQQVKHHINQNTMESNTVNQNQMNQQQEMQQHNFSSNLMSVQNLRTILPKPFDQTSSMVTGQSMVTSNVEMDTVKPENRVNISNMTFPPNQMFNKAAVSVAQNFKTPIIMSANLPFPQNLQGMIGTMPHEQFLQQLNEKMSIGNTSSSLSDTDKQLPGEAAMHHLSELSQQIPQQINAQNRRRSSKHSDNGGGQLEVASALLSMGTGNETTQDMTSVLQEPTKLTDVPVDSNLEDLIENSLRGECSNVTVAFCDNGTIKIDDVEIDPAYHELKKGNTTFFFSLLRG